MKFPPLLPEIEMSYSHNVSTFQVMTKFAYVVSEEEAGFTKYIEVTLGTHNSGVILNGIMKICPEPF